MNSYGVRPARVLVFWQSCKQQRSSHVCTKLGVAVVMEVVNGGLFDGAIHTFDLSVGPGMPGLCEAMIDSVQKTDPVEGVSAETSRAAFTIFGQIGELDSVVGEYGMNAIRNGCHQGQKKGCGCLHIGSFYTTAEGLKGIIENDELWGQLGIFP